MRRITTAAMIVLAALFVVPTATAGRGGDGKKDNDTRVQILGFNDFHGHVEPNTPGTIQTGQSRNPTTGAIVNEVVPAGGAEYLATHVKALRTTNSNTITVASGDLIGASPLLSGLFHDEPAIEALNVVGLDVSGVGNHEFDEGLGEIYRMMNGGCHPVDGCQDGTPFLGSVFGYLAANVFFAGTDDTILPPYEVRKVGNAMIAFMIELAMMPMTMARHAASMEVPVDTLRVIDSVSASTSVNPSTKPPTSRPASPTPRRT